jgi:hypothetical protein
MLDMGGCLLRPNSATIIAMRPREKRGTPSCHCHDARSSPLFPPPRSLPACREARPSPRTGAMMRPGLLTVAIIVALNAWNEFVIAVTFLQNENNITAIVKFYNLTG